MFLVCATTETEGQTASLACPSGFYIQSIDFSSFGTPTGTCGNFLTSDCDSFLSMSAVSDRCLNRNSCQVVAETGVFADPCGGILKHLYIQATCTSKGYDALRMPMKLLKYLFYVDGLMNT
eukprot:gene61237-83763_t